MKYDGYQELENAKLSLSRHFCRYTYLVIVVPIFCVFSKEFLDFLRATEKKDDQDNK